MDNFLYYCDSSFARQPQYPSVHVILNKKFTFFSSPDMQLKEILVVLFQILVLATQAFPHLNNTVLLVNKCRSGWFKLHTAIIFFSFMTHTIAWAKHSSLYCSRLTVKPVICKQTSPNFLRFTTLVGLGRGSFTTSNRPEPASNSSRRQLEHFRFYTSAIFIASLALHADLTISSGKREPARGREEEANNNIACTKKREKQVLMKDARKLDHVTWTILCRDWTLMQDAVSYWLLIELADGTALSQCLLLRLSKVE